MQVSYSRSKLLGEIIVTVFVHNLNYKKKKYPLSHAIITAKAKSIFEDRNQKDGSDETFRQSELNAFFKRKTRDSIGEVKSVHDATPINHECRGLMVTLTITFVLGFQHIQVNVQNLIFV